jgi:predicted DNA-binding transcriptional regulator AlpA
MRRKNDMVRESENEYLDTPATCALIGGNRPIHPSTLWRWVKAGRISAPVKIGPHTVRFRRTQLVADLSALACREIA